MTVTKTAPKKAVKRVAAVSAATKPAPQPGDKNFDWQAEYPGEDILVFTSSTGKTVGLAAMSDKRRPSMGMLRQIRKADGFEQMFSTIELVACPAALEVSDQFGDKDYAEMFKQWSEFVGTTPGE